MSKKSQSFGTLGKVLPILSKALYSVAMKRAAIIIFCFSLLPLVSQDLLGNQFDLSEELLEYLIPTFSDEQQDCYSFRAGRIIAVEEDLSGQWHSYIDVAVEETNYSWFYQNQIPGYIVRYGNITPEPGLKPGDMVSEEQLLGSLAEGAQAISLSAYSPIPQHPFLSIYTHYRGEPVDGGFYLYPPYFLDTTPVDFFNFAPMMKTALENNIYRQWQSDQAESGATENYYTDTMPYRFYSRLEEYPQGLTERSNELMEKPYLNQLINMGAGHFGISHEYVEQRGPMTMHYYFTEPMTQSLIDEIELGDSVFYYGRFMGFFENDMFIYIADFAEEAPEVYCQYNSQVEPTETALAYKAFMDDLQGLQGLLIPQSETQSGELLESEPIINGLYDFLRENPMGEHNNSVISDLMNFMSLNKFSFEVIEEPDPVFSPGFSQIKYLGNGQYLCGVDREFLQMQNSNPRYFYSSLFFALEQCYAWHDNYFLLYPREYGFLRSYHDLMNACNVQATFLTEGMPGEDSILQEAMLYQSKLQDELAGYSHFIYGINMEMAYYFSSMLAQARMGYGLDSFLEGVIAITDDMLNFYSGLSPESLNQDSYVQGINLWTAVLSLGDAGELISHSLSGQGPEIEAQLNELLNNLEKLKEIGKESNIYGEEVFIKILQQRSTLLDRISEAQQS